MSHLHASVGLAEWNGILSHSKNGRVSLELTHRVVSVECTLVVRGRLEVVPAVVFLLLVYIGGTASDQIVRVSIG